jgi:hypothetical protein
MLMGATMVPPRRFPSLVLPFVASCNPHEHRLGAHLRRWVEGWTGDPGAAVQVGASRFHELVARVYPHAGPRRLEAIAELITWMFLFDDHFDVGRLGGDPARAEAAAEQVISLAHGAVHHGGGPLLRALGPIKGRFQEVRPGWWPRIADDLGIFVASVVREVRQRADRTALSVAEYAAQRQETFAWGVLVDLVEFAHGSEVPERVRADPRYRALVQAAGTVMWATVRAEAGRRVVVVGGGIAGLAAAFRLQQAGCAVTVLEKDGRVGGRMSTIEHNGYLIDAGASVLMSNYTRMLRLISDAGLSSDIQPTSDLIGFLRDSTVHRFRAHARRDLLRSRLLSPRGTCWTHAASWRAERAPAALPPKSAATWPPSRSADLCTPYYGDVLPSSGRGSSRLARRAMRRPAVGVPSRGRKTFTRCPVQNRIMSQVSSREPTSGWSIVICNGLNGVTVSLSHRRAKS